MFLGGAGHEITRIRTDSVKGALAFWWQALNFGMFVEREGSVDAALKAMQKDVVRIFGGPSGQGAVQPRLVSGPGAADGLKTNDVLGQNGKRVTNLSNVRDKIPGGVGIGARYLGLGLMAAFTSKKHLAGKLARPCFVSDDGFSLRFVLLKRLTQDDIASVREALIAFGLLGGLGSRVRRGWGSISLKGLSQEGQVVRRPGLLQRRAPRTPHWSGNCLARWRSRSGLSFR